MHLASYIAVRPGLPGLFNRFVRAILWCEESHSELVFSDGSSFSCSWLDGGPRFKTIDFDPAHWAFTEVPDSYDEGRARRAAEAICKGGEMKYSLLLLVAQIFPFLLRWVPVNGEMCSSAIALVLGMPGHRRYEPHELRLAMEHK